MQDFVHQQYLSELLRTPESLSPKPEPLTPCDDPLSHCGLPELVMADGKEGMKNNKKPNP